LTVVPTAPTLFLEVKCWVICPTCKSIMLVVEHQQIELDYCPKCSGVWFDSGELELLLEKLDITARQLDVDGLVNAPETHTAEIKRRCPSCNHKMKKATIGHNPPILIDTCDNGDGLWFDGGELHQLVNQLTKETGTKGTQQQIIAFLGEAFKAEE
jgi:Zn-finger nucleic acid-binding protein